MITICTITGFVAVLAIVAKIVVVLCQLCWWVGAIAAVLAGGAFLDFTVVKHGLRSIFKKRD